MPQTSIIFPDSSINTWFDAESQLFVYSWICYNYNDWLICFYCFFFCRKTNNKCWTRECWLPSKCPQNVWCAFCCSSRATHRSSPLEDRLTHWVNILGNLLRCLCYQNPSLLPPISTSSKPKDSKPKHFIICDKIFMSFLWELFTIKSNQDTFLMNAFIYECGWKEERRKIFAMNNLFVDARPREA